MELFFKTRRVEVVALELHDIVQVDGVGHNHKILALHRNDERLIHAHIINVIGEAQLLQ